jgi:hypothetical protein
MVNVIPNTSTIFSAYSIDTAGNFGPCSNTITYTHDNIAPSTPTIVSSSPASPSRISTSPTLTVTGGEPGSICSIYNSSNCSGTIVATGTFNVSGTASIAISVTANTTTQFTATATDAAGNVSACSNVFTYTHDAIAPSAPVLLSTTPTSPSNTSTTPTIIFSAEPQSTVRIYNGSTCTGALLAQSNTALSGSGAAIVSVASNSITVFSATSTDAAGNISGCSNVLSYTHDNVPPTTPVIVSSTPASPGNSTTPTISLTGTAGTTFYIYSNGTGTGSPIASGTFNASGIGSIIVTVNSNATTTLSAKSIDAAGNSSAVSSPFNYTHAP